MFHNFRNYMYYLLNAPLKKIKDGKNQLKIFFTVTGAVFDEMHEDILKFQRQKMISKADQAMLELIGQDRDMFRLQGETIEQYRNRLQMKAILAEMGGTNTGLLLVMKVLGYSESTIEPLYKTDRNRWAEIYINVLITHDINYDAILYEVLKVKTARTLPYFRFWYPIQAKPIKSAAAGGIGIEIKVKARLAEAVMAANEDRAVPVLFVNHNISVKADNEIKAEDVYVLSETGEKIRILTENRSVVRIR